MTTFITEIQTTYKNKIYPLTVEVTYHVLLEEIVLDYVNVISSGNLQSTLTENQIDAIKELCLINES